MEKIRIGGQAVIEGVMMRGKKAYSIVVRKPDGHFVVQKEKINNWYSKIDFFKLPILRGIIALIDNLTLGIKALSFSANQFVKDEEEKESLSTGEILLSFLIAFGVGFLLFFLLPLALTNIIKNYLIDLNSSLLFNFVDGMLRIIIFIVYIYFISRLEDIQRVFQYHGAEHKAVFNFESGEMLSVENAEKFSRLHPRCGTSFLLLVMMISILVFSFIPRDITIIQKAFFRFGLLPIIVGLSYEFIKISGENAEHPLINILIQPGMLLQKLTTREPTKEQLNVAIAAIKEVLTIENE